MAKFPEAAARLFKNVFVCKNCKTKVRSTPQKINLNQVVCKNCGKKAFRAIKKGQKKAAGA